MHYDAFYTLIIEAISCSNYLSVLSQDLVRGLGMDFAGMSAATF